MSRLSLTSLLVAVVLLGGLGARAQAQEATPPSALEIDPNGVFASEPELLQPAPVGPFPAGEPGELAVVGQAAAEDGSSLLVVVRNNTTEPIRHAAVAGRVLDGDDIVALGASSTSLPFDIVPNGMGMFVVPFEDPIADIALLSAAELRVTTTEDTNFFGWETIDVVDVVLNPAEVLLGIASRGQGGVPTNFEEVIVVCLASDGQEPIASWAQFTFEKEIESGRAVSVSASNPIGECDGPVISAAAGNYR